MAGFSEVGIKAGRVDIHDRLGLREMRRTIQGQPIRAAVEIIINSDDSYRLVEEEGDISKKTTKVFCDTKARQVVILDHAKGMSYLEVDNAYTILGAPTSGYSSGKKVGGFFGTGAKAAMACMEDGITYTIQDGMLVSIRVFIENEELKYHMEGPQPVDDELRATLQIPGNGTRVQFKIPKDDRQPRFDTFHEGLSNHYRLRKILSNPIRRVELIDTAKGKKPRKRSLGYVPPPGRQVLDDVFLIDYEGFGTFTVSMSLWRAESELTQYGDDRLGGLLILDEIDNVLDCTLFRFDHDEYAKHFFGEVKIDRFRDLLSKEAQVILTPERDGLNPKNPFCMKLIEEVERRLGAQIEIEKEKAKSAVKTKLDSEETKRFQKAFSILNEIAEIEAKPVVGFGNPDEREMDPPPNGLCLMPAVAHISVGKQYGFRVIADTNVVTRGSEIKVSAPNGRLKLSTNKIEIPQNHDDRIFSRYFVVEGLVANTESEIMVSNGDVNSKAIVYVTPEKTDRELLKVEGLLFQPSSVTLRPNKVRKVQLFIYIKRLEHGSIVNINSDNDAIQLSDSVITVDETKAEKHMYIKEIEIWSKGEGQRGIITAGSGNYMALLEVSVKEEPTSGSKGMFRQPEFDLEPDPPQRSSWDRRDGLVKIHVRFPTVEIYLGRECQSKGTPQAQAIVAEIVAERCFQVIARERIEKNELIDPAGKEYAIQQLANDLEKRYGYRVHKALVSPDVIKPV